MIISPVIPIFAPFVRKAQSRGIEVIGEIELGYRYCSRGTHFVCIGGTNGKTTTTALTGEIFKANGEGQTFVLGNIGIPITEHASETRRATPLLRKLPRSSSKASVTFMPMQPGF